MDNRKIGIFDSGIGGLTVVRALFNTLPNERVVYFGDSLNMPYGSRSKEEITRLSLNTIEFLKGKDVKAVVVACNTISAMCIDDLRKAVDVPVIDVIVPGSVAAAHAAKKGVGIIATQNTIASGVHERILREHNPDIEVYSLACPLLAPLAEEGLYETEAAYTTAREYLSGFGEGKIDCLLLGCTHYPLLENALRAATDVPLLDPAVYVAQELKDMLTAMGALAEGNAAGADEFFTSGDSVEFDGHVLRVLDKANESEHSRPQRFKHVNAYTGGYAHSH